MSGGGFIRSDYTIIFPGLPFFAVEHTMPTTITFRLVLMVRAQKADRSASTNKLRVLFMKHMRKTTVTLLVIGVLTAAGCQSITSKGQKTDTSPDMDTQAAPPLTDTSVMEDYQGFYMTVEIGGEQTVMSQKEGGVQIWTVSACAATPTIVFTMDENKLGTLKKASIAFNPLKAGKVDLSNFYLYAGGTKFLPGSELELDVFNHFHDGRMDQNVKKLPPGEYRISIQVNGGKSWDRQYVDTEVK